MLCEINVAFQKYSELLNQDCNTAFLMEKNASHATEPHCFPLHLGEALDLVGKHQNRGKADQLHMKKIELFQFCFCSLLLNKVTLTTQFLTNSKLYMVFRHQPNGKEKKRKKHNC